MNWIMMAATAILFAVNLVACGRSEEPTPTTQHVSAGKIETPDVGIAKLDPQRANLQKERDETKKQETINRIRIALGLRSPGRDSIDKKRPAWAQEVASPSGPAATACADLEKFNELSYAFGVIGKAYSLPYEISWEDIAGDTATTVAADAKAAYRKLGRSVAAGFVDAFNMPQIARAKTQCGRGEGSFTLDEGDRLMTTILYVLTEVNESPATIKQTPGSLRSMLRIDFIARLSEIRKGIAEGRASESDGMGHFLFVAREAVEEWKFAPGELKLTKQEIAAYGDYRRRW
ncbi:MAG: hypothetical protein UY60_C0017G0021 [Parcubacteria group bacterium GW2011_GWB1_50_9]|nr:MAG: hypothetical protein UY60_C0017G0021 [Parcubacteria group bacterium GW2011_GWB1_50_9]